MRPKGARPYVMTLDNPPVNALSFAYSERLLAAIEDAEADGAVKAVVFAGANGIFSGGADVNDFNAEMPPDARAIRDVIAAIERGRKTLRRGHRRQRARRRPRTRVGMRLSRRDAAIETRSAGN